MADVARLLFRTAAEGLVVVGAGGGIELVNPRLCELFGYEEQELIGQRIELLVPEASADRHAVHRERYEHAPAKRSMGTGLELVGRRKDGSLLPVEVSLNHLRIGGKVHVMGLVTDVSLRRRAELELRRSNEELEMRVQLRTRELEEAQESVREALEKERELNALKSRFVSMASHEFRTPLSTIMSSVDLIRRYTAPQGDERVDKHVQRIRAKVRDLTGMLNDFLSLEKLEQGHVHVSPSDFDVVHLCIDLVEELRLMAKPGQELRYDHEGDASMVHLDRGILGNVITNLLGNAMKYSPEGAPIDMHTRIAAGRLTVDVADRGIGIPAEDQQHLFQRFFRAANAVTTQGTGLGLSIVKRYVDMMGGTIDFESAVGKGTRFIITFPERIAPRNDDNA
jgi:PAS domain S-box-containing protein